jgi:glycylpeptide N-tetradecanoyltransferase
VTRQCHLKGVFQAIYTAGVVIPTPVSVCRYYHRLLNIPKLVNTRFCFVPRNMTLARMVRINKLPSATTLSGLREMEEKDIVAVTHLHTEYMKRFDMVPLYDIDEIRHHFLSGRGEGEVGSGGPGRRQRQVTWAYVVEVRPSEIVHSNSANVVNCRIQKLAKLLISSRSIPCHLR